MSQKRPSSTIWPRAVQAPSRLSAAWGCRRCYPHRDRPASLWRLCINIELFQPFLSVLSIVRDVRERIFDPDSFVKVPWLSPSTLSHISANIASKIFQNQKKFREIQLLSRCQIRPQERLLHLLCDLRIRLLGEMEHYCAALDGYSHFSFVIGFLCCHHIIPLL